MSRVIKGIFRLRLAHTVTSGRIVSCDVFSACSQHSPPAQLQHCGNTMSIYYPPGRPARYAGKLKQG